MNEARWEAIQTVFARAVEHPPEQREAVARELCAEDETLFVEVMELLEEDSRSQPVLDGSLADAAAAVLDLGSLPSLIKRQIGPYKVLDFLGEGGMGVVYLAERTDIGGRVAIKLLRDAWFSPMRRERFRLEQMALAQLNHPSIARIYDSNTLEDGTPWFVMEYAHGQPLTEYWKRRSGSVGECLDLMRKVCEAVHYAHSHAIIHRDLKPSNILVDDNGEVKLLDFGIAKQLTAGEENDRKTGTGLRLMTLPYAAPEQLSGQAIGMYTDVYALGVLLFELLTGRLPLRTHTADGSVAEQDIERPSAVVRREKPELFAKAPRSDWVDLDSLVLKALAYQGGNRYGTVDSLMRDIDAFREGRPLEARSIDWRYTLAKFARRNRRGLAATAALLLILAATMTFYTARLAHARDIAVREAERTLRIQKFTENLFEGGDQPAGPAANLRVTELLDRGLHEADALGNDPLMQADMRQTLGTIYQKLGKLEIADSLLRSSLEQRRKALGERDPKVAESLVSLASLQKDQGKLDSAEQLAREGIKATQNLAGGDAALARAMVQLGSVLVVRGRYDEAIQVLQSALKLQREHATSTSDNADTLIELANASFYKGQYPESTSYNQQALEIYRRQYGNQHPAVAQVFNNLGAIESNRGNYAASEANYRNALAIIEAWYGTDHPETAANLTALAQQLSYEDRDDDAQKLLERALAIQKRVDGGITATVATTENQLGVLALNRKQYDAARSHFDGARKIWEQSRGDQHEFVAVAYSNIGSVCLEEKNFLCAEANFRQAVRRLDAQSNDTLNAAIAHLKLGRSLLRQSRFKDAESETLHAYLYLVNHMPPGNNFLVAARKDLVAIYEGLFRKEDAARYRSEITLLSSPKSK